MKLLSILLLLSCTLLPAVTITDHRGVETSIDYEQLASEPRQDLLLEREKDGVPSQETWQGIRFDHWLRERFDQSYKVIRFESVDRYRVSFSKAEFDTLACWLVFALNGETLPEQGLRVIFPGLREMKWVKDLDRVVLEDFDPLQTPARFEWLDQRLKDSTLYQDPAPFVNTAAYYFAELLPLSARSETRNVVLYSRDGLKLSLEYPQHLEGAILEPTDEGFNLKSPRIPGGMWLKDIIYIQIDELGLIHSGNLDAIIALNRSLDWKMSPDARFRISQGARTRQLTLNELLTQPELLIGVESFCLEP
ncbi:MAG TPA: molybdopterin-dependent oxidoreductase [Candidatus Syntrophosphaera sp.]|nr:molybdopterin-dependent oxidoreductase [Candidatus Syntrophosphaera sp.]